MTEEKRTSERQAGSGGSQKGTTYELFILAVSLLSIANLAFLAIVEYQSQYWWLVAQIDIALTLIFAIDFTYRLRTAPSKGGYMWRGGGVFDLLGCLPGLRIFRLFRVVRAVRIIRRLAGSGCCATSATSSHRARST